MKIAYAGFDLMYPALETLVNDGHNIVKVFSCKTDNVCEFNTRITDISNRNKIPITYDRITAEDLIWLRNIGCEMLLTAGYYYRMPIDPEIKMINIHPAYLPVGRGAWPMPVTILNGFDSSGVTIHKMEESFDTGDILLRRRFRVDPHEDLVSFMDKVCALIPEMVRELCSDLQYLYENAVTQGAGEYWECPNEADYAITQSTHFAEADRILRAFMGYECVYKTDSKTYLLQYGKATRDEISDKRFPIDGGYIYAPVYRLRDSESSYPLDYE